MSKEIDKLSKSAWVAILISILAVGISLSAFIWNIYQENRIYEHSFTIDALSHKPLLELVDEIKLESIGLKFTGKPKKLRGVFEDSMFIVVAETLVIDFDITGHFKICNTGNDAATMTFYTILDTTATEDILRKWLLGKRDIESRWDSVCFDFDIIDITPGETLVLPIKKRFQFVTDVGEAVLHLLILYENQFGALFDTYCWMRFKCNLLTDLNKQSGKYYIPSEEKIRNAIKATKSRASYKLYKPHEKEKAISIIKKARQKTEEKK